MKFTPDAGVGIHIYVQYFVGIIKVRQIYSDIFYLNKYWRLERIQKWIQYEFKKLVVLKVVEVYVLQ